MREPLETEARRCGHVAGRQVIPLEEAADVQRELRVGWILRRAHYPIYMVLTATIYDLVPNLVTG